MTRSQSLSWSGWKPTRREAAALALPLLVAAADVLFFGHAIGVSLAIFLALLGLAPAFAHAHVATRRERLAGGLLLALAIAPLVESVDPIAVGFALVGTAVAALIATGNARAGWRETARRTAALAAANPLATRREVREMLARVRAGRLASLPRLALSWAVPVVLGLGFVALFSLANPIFRSVVGMIDLLRLMEFLDPLRIAFWLGAGAFAAAFVGMRFAPRAASPTPAIGLPFALPTLPPAMAVRCLIVFNAVFALETGIDITHLWTSQWSGTPPPGIGYAAHAHEAAYLLVFTAILSAAFVLVTTGTREKGPPPRLLRGLNYLWIAQNVLLVLSAMLRLDIYVDAYSLTRLRFAAFVWMGLVAFGLVAIVLRIAASRDNRWLVATNLAALGLAVYACGIVDVNRVIADFNVAHAREADGDGMGLDPDYLCALGPSALPAIDRFIAAHIRLMPGSPEWQSLQSCAGGIERELAARSDDWRAWTFRDHRLRAHAADRYERIRSGLEQAEKVLDAPDDPRR